MYVGRPSRWGNPFSADKYGAGRAVEYFRAFLTGELPPCHAGEYDEALRDYRRAEKWFYGTGPAPLYPGEAAVIVLRNATALACWCPLDQPCHADVLIELLS